MLLETLTYIVTILSFASYTYKLIGYLKTTNIKFRLPTFRRSKKNYAYFLNNKLQRWY